jgi:hypothetical protein
MCVLKKYYNQLGKLVTLKEYKKQFSKKSAKKIRHIIDIESLPNKFSQSLSL